MDDRVDTRRLVRELFSMLHVPTRADDVDLFETGALDSLGFAYLLFLLEDRLGVAVDLTDIDAEWFRTIGQIARFVEQTYVDAARRDLVRNTGDRESPFITAGAAARPPARIA